MPTHVPMFVPRSPASGLTPGSYWLLLKVRHTGRGTEICLPTVKTDMSHRSPDSPGYMSPRRTAVIAFLEIFWLLMVTQKMSSGAQDCFPRPSVQRPIHNFTTTLDTPN